MDKLGLSPKALQLISEQPDFWEHILFGQVMADEVEKVNNLFKQGHRAKGVENAKIDSTIEFISDWLQNRMGELQSIISELSNLFNSNHDDAFGPSGVPGNPENIILYARKIVAFYYRAITLLQLIQSTSVNSECEEAHKELGLAVTGIIKNIGSFGVAIVRQVEEAIKAPSTGEKRTVSLSLTLTLPDSFTEAVNRLVKSESENMSKLAELVNIALERAKNDKIKSSTKKSGYIYVLTNPSTNGIVKIGKTQRHPNDRAKELSSATGVPTPFVVVYHAQFDSIDEAEMFVHTKLENYRVANNREFFQIEIPAAIDVVIEAKKYYEKLSRNTMSTSIGDENLFSEYDVDDEETNEPGEDLYNAADEYYYGSGDTIQDYDEAFSIYEKSARLGFVDAFLQMGIMCRDGEGRSPNKKLAREYFNEAIKLGRDDGWAEMARMFNADLNYDNEAKCWGKYFSSKVFSAVLECRLNWSRKPSSTTEEIIEVRTQIELIEKRFKGLFSCHSQYYIIYEYVVSALKQNKPLEHEKQIRLIKDDLLDVVVKPRIKTAKEMDRTYWLDELMKIEKFLGEM